MPLGIKVSIDKAESLKEMKTKLNEMLVELQKEVDKKPLIIKFDNDSLNLVMKTLSEIRNITNNMNINGIGTAFNGAVQATGQLAQNMDNVAKTQAKIKNDLLVSDSITSRNGHISQKDTQYYNYNKNDDGSLTRVNGDKVTEINVDFERAYKNIRNIQNEIHQLKIKNLTADENTKKYNEDIIQQLEQETTAYKSQLGTRQDLLDTLDKENKRLDKKYVAKKADVDTNDANAKATQNYKEAEKALNNLYATKEKIAKLPDSKPEELSALEKIRMAEERVLNTAKAKLDINQKINFNQLEVDKKRSLAVAQGVADDRRNAEWQQSIIRQQNEAYNKAKSSLSYQEQLRKRLINAGEQEKKVIQDILKEEVARYNNEQKTKVSQKQHLDLLERERQLEEEISVAQARQNDRDDDFDLNGAKTIGFKFSELTEWLLIRKGIQSAMNSMRDGIVFVYNMNKAMTEISIVTGMTQRQVENLSKTYNSLAKEMAVSTEEIAKASVEYYRQGLSTEEVNQRMKQTIQYAKVAGMALEEASTVLTATVNSMDIDIQRASDVFAYLGDATATGKNLCPLAQ